MELRQLRHFVAVAEELHFRRAARRVGLTQPALSHQIAQLEKELEVRLFERSRRSVQLTDPGAVLLERARKILHDVEIAQLETQRAGAATERRLRLGYLEYMNLPFLPAALRRLAETEPDIEVVHRELYSDEAVAAVIERTLDVGMAFVPVKHPALVARQLLEGRWVVVVRERHRFAKLAEVPISELAEERLILFARSLNPPVFDRFVAELERANVAAKIVYQTAQARTGPSLVAEGLGVFIVGSYVMPELPRGLVARPLAGFDSVLRVGAVWHVENRSRGLRAFLAALDDVWGPKAPRRRAKRSGH